MIVSKDNMGVALEDIATAPLKGFDTETYGVRFQDRLFSLIVSTPKDDYYFNFNGEPDHLGKLPPIVLKREDTFEWLRPLFGMGVWASHNAPFDIQKLRLEIPGLMPMHVHCTLSTERILRNDFMDYTLFATAKRYGLEKDDSVEEYIKEHKLQTRVRIPGKKRVDVVPHFDKVPFDMVVKYGCKDAKLHRQIAQVQRFALGLSERDGSSSRHSEDAGAGDSGRFGLCAAGTST